MAAMLGEIKAAPKVEMMAEYWVASMDENKVASKVWKMVVSWAGLRVD